MTNDELKVFASNEARNVVLAFLLAKVLQGYNKTARKAIMSGIRDTWKQDVRNNIGDVVDSVDAEQLSVMAIKAIKLADPEMSQFLVTAESLAKEFDEIEEE